MPQDTQLTLNGHGAGCVDVAIPDADDGLLEVSSMAITGTFNGTGSTTLSQIWRFANERGVRVG